MVVPINPSSASATMRPTRVRGFRPSMAMATICGSAPLSRTGRNTSVPAISSGAASSSEVKAT
ncbi:hypothetical protein D7006_03975 [Xanthobacter sp. YC-JY1]|nr:hypothetical protein D7006_03975 [Xanthobacter sp. YC-JY1]